MALTQEMIKAQQMLSALTQEQIDAIVSLSANDETIVIGKRIGELHGQYDTDVLSITGIAKNSGEKSYDYVKRILGDNKAKLEASKAAEDKITALAAEKADLEAKLKNNAGDAVVKQQLQDTTAKMQQLQTLYDSIKAEHDKTKSDYEQQLGKIKFDTTVDTAFAGLKFKAALPEIAKEALIKNAKDLLQTKYKLDTIDVNGEKVTVFRDDKGNIAYNPSNQLKPYTATELLSENLKDALDFGANTPGGGTGNPAQQAGVAQLDLGSARTQVAADEVITKHLAAMGFARGTQEFAEEQTKIRKENAVDKLPLK